MLVRLLLAVLTVAGPMPVGVCTCAAAGSPTVPPARVAAELAPVATKSCGCQRHAAEDATLAADAAPRHADGCAEQPARHDHHDRDCPAANPSSAAPATPPTPVADQTADPCLAPAAPLDAPVCGRTAPRPDPAPLPLPLYLSHCSIRV